MTRRVGIVSRTATYWPLYLMAEEHDVDLIELGSTSAGVDALLDQRVDVAATCPDALIASGAHVAVACGLVDRPPTTIVAAPDVRAVADLRGRRIATTQPSGSVSVFLRAALRALGLAAGDYTPVVCGPTPAQADALARGQVDAAMLTFPFDQELVARGFVPLADVGAVLGPCAFTTLNVRRGFMRAAAWRPFHDAVVRQAARLRDGGGQAAALDVLARATGIRVEAPPAGLLFDTRVPEAGLERLIAFMRDDGAAVGGAARTYVEDAGE